MVPNALMPAPLPLPWLASGGLLLSSCPRQPKGQELPAAVACHLLLGSQTATAVPPPEYARSQFIALARVRNPQSLCF